MIISLFTPQESKKANEKYLGMINGEEASYMEEISVLKL